MYFLYGFIACVLILIGHAIGKAEGEKEGLEKGFREGIQAALDEINNQLNEEIQLPLDPNIAQRLINKKSANN